jgi:hypothetical protein
MSGPAPEIGAIATTYNAELDTLKGWINLRLQWLDANIPGVCSNTGVSTINNSNEIKCYPNPSNNYFNIEYSLSASINVSVSVYNYLGAEVLSIKKGIQNNGHHSLKLETINLSPGIYILKIKRGEDILKKKIVVTK